MDDSRLGIAVIVALKAQLGLRTQSTYMSLSLNSLNGVM